MATNDQTAPATPVVAPAATAPVAAPVVAKTDEVAAKDLAAKREDEQKVQKDLNAKNEKAAKEDDYFQKVANDDKVFVDPYREAARQERLRESEALKGDPTRDPVAKQQAMDKNTPLPGVAEDAKDFRK